MATSINGCFIDMLLYVRRHVYKTIWNAFVGEVLVCKQEIPIKAMAFTVFESGIYNCFDMYCSH